MELTPEQVECIRQFMIDANYIDWMLDTVEVDKEVFALFFPQGVQA